jgi:hypothetical protein
MPEAADPTPREPADWYAQMPRSARVYIQAGFAGVVAVAFIGVVGVMLVMFQGLQRQLAEQSREDRIMFREELRSQREELRAAVVEMRRAVDHLDSGQRQIKADVKTLKEAGPDAFKAPSPRTKDDTGGQ